MDANEHFEAVAALFFRATGHLAPGKSEPWAAASEDGERERRRLWEAFCAGRDSVREVAYMRQVYATPTAETEDDGA